MARLIALALLSFMPTTSLAADWPQWLGPKRDGSTSEIVSPWKDKPKEAWRVKVGPGFSCPVVSEGRVFIHAQDGSKDREIVFAFDAKTGKEIWKTGYDRAPYMSVLNNGPQATPAVSGNRVFTFGITGILGCFDTETGKSIWQVDALKAFAARVPRFGVCCSPIVIGNRVIVAAGGKGSSIVAFDTETGDVQWKVLDETAGTSSPVLMSGSKSRGGVPDVVFMTTLRVIGLSPLDGTVNWDHALPFQPSGTAPTPVVLNDLVVTSTMSNGSTGIRVENGEKATTKQVWQTPTLSGYFSTGVATPNDRFYLVTNILKPLPQADLACVDLKTGKELWRKASVGYFHFGVIRTGDGTLLVLDDGGMLRLIADDPKGYRELCSTKVCGGTFCAPVLANGHAFARDNKELVCVSLVP